MVWHYSSFRVTQGGRIEDAIQSIKRSMKECSVCETMIDFINMSACELLKRFVKPYINVDDCRKILAKRLEGWTPEEIAKALGVDVQVLIDAVNKAVDIAEEAYREVFGKKRKK